MTRMRTTMLVGVVLAAPPLACSSEVERADATDTSADGSSSSDAMTSATDATSEPTGGPTTAGSMSASGSETESSSGTTGGGCTLSLECLDPASPICVDEACAPCSSDDECLEKNPGAPACGDDGRCVVCTPSNASACTDTTPICNAVNECEGCDFHEQCVGTACDIATGACFAEDCVVEVDGDGGADYQNIQAALVDGCVVIVHELNAGASYQQAVSVDGIKVAVLAADGEEPLLLGTGGNPSLTVSNDGVAYVQGLGINGNQMVGVGVSVDGATVYLDRTSVVGNTGGGLMLTNDGQAHLRNCFVGGDVNQPALEVQDGNAFVLYSTLAGSFGNSPALTCAVGGDTEVRNSILVSQDDGAEYSCAAGEVTYSATEAAVAGVGNVAVDDVDDAGWFAGYDSGDFGLTPAGAAVFGDVAQWVVGDPLVDIDGDARPTEPGPDVAGGDIPE